MKIRIFIKTLWLLGIVLTMASGKAMAQLSLLNPNYSIGTTTGKYSFPYNQTPDPLVEINPPGINILGFTYQWESSTSPVFPDHPPVIGTSGSYTFSGPLTQTTWFRRKATSSLFNLSSYSNIVKISVVSVNWEDLNYIRGHDIVTSGITDWQTIDQMPVGQKLQTTTYMDGLGRSIETISRETATPAQAGGTWGDMVKFDQYDVRGMEQQQFLPYTTTTESGKFKSAPATEQPQYYTNVYNEGHAYNYFTFDQSPRKRVTKIQESGDKWAGTGGSNIIFDVNVATDNVQIWGVSYIRGSAPVNRGVYPAGSLYVTTMLDVNGNKVVEYTTNEGKLILKKVQLDAAPSAAHAGWICTYSVYDDWGQLRYQIQPEGVKYLDANSWSFSGTNGQTVLAEYCFQYDYDDKGHTIWKKSPGTTPLNMLYDVRDRVVFTQDGNQAAPATPQWTAKLYDELDRPIETVLYNTTESVSSLQADISNSVATTTVTIPAHTAATDVDPTFYQRDPNRPLYIATHSITFATDGTNNFQTATGDVFVAEIDPTPTTPAYTGTVTTFNKPISDANLSNSAVTTVLNLLYYDNYAFNGVKSFDNNFTNTTAYSTSDPNVMPIAASQRTLSLPTGTMTRVLGTNTFLASTNYYDEKGRLTQVLKDNIKTGIDIETVQHHFDGRILSKCSSHTTPGTGYSAFITLTKHLFDKLGRTTSVQMQIGSNPLKTVTSYDYDDLGRVKTKHLDPTYNSPNLPGPDLESLNFSFNIHNQLTGINKDYALKTPATYDKWGHFFGLYIGFDNKDNVFSARQLNGQVEGLLWNTQGDDAQRKYEYTYDNASRLINASYTEQQHPGDGWNNTKMDFSVNGVSGQITYDLNGNLLTMLQKGVVPGMSSPITIDDLRYSHGANSTPYSNKLQSVADQMTTTNSNGLSGDFKDGSNGAAPDYVYDNNGNLVIDLNKNVQNLNNGTTANGISYNFLDKPDQIRIVGKGTIKIVYSATGEKLQRVFIPESGGTSTITTYIGEYVYQETGSLTLSSPAPFSGTGLTPAFINFEEGRIRVMTAATSGQGYDVLLENGNINLPNGKMGVWDYFVRDYQGNTRMILTEETHVAGNTCTMETSRKDTEDPIFGQTGGGNEVEATRTGTPSAWQSANSTASVSELGNIAGHNIGPNTLQKVMAGDQVTASAIYYFAGTPTSSNPNIIPNVLNSLAAAMGGNATAGSLVHTNATPITNQLSNTPGFVSAVEPSNSTGGAPQAYLTILFFDERFNFISAADGGLSQQQVASSWSADNQTLGLLKVKAPKNGYAYVYVSNRSDQSVFFDNLAVSINSGNIIEENHYYAFGLKIAAISSHKLGDAAEGNLRNNYLYNDKELFDDGDLGWYDYGFRNYDPQIGRFAQLDPLTDDFAAMTPYQYSSNDPITNVDLDGMEGVESAGGTAISAAGEFFQGSKEIDLASVVVRFVKPAAVASTGIDLIGISARALLYAARFASDLINASFFSLPAGRALPAVIGRTDDRRGREDMKEEDGHVGDLGQLGTDIAGKSDKELLRMMRGLINMGTASATAEMITIAQQMFQQFSSKKGGTFRRAALDRIIKNDQRYQNFLQEFKARFEAALKENNGNIGAIINDPVRLQQVSPKFNDNTGGLGITVDALNYVQIVLAKYEIIGNNYSISVQVQMFDSFGLDTPDILNFGKADPKAKWYQKVGLWLKRQIKGGFAAWWILQHVRGYKHLNTEIINNETIKGTF